MKRTLLFLALMMSLTLFLGCYAGHYSTRASVVLVDYDERFWFDDHWVYRFRVGDGWHYRSWYNNRWEDERRENSFWQNQKWERKSRNERDDGRIYDDDRRHGDGEKDNDRNDSKGKPGKGKHHK